MKAKVYVDPFKGRVIMDESVEVLEITPLPKITKSGRIYKIPFPSMDREKPI